MKNTPLPPPPPPKIASPVVVPVLNEEDEDDYDPDFTSAEDTEQILNKLDNSTPESLKTTPNMELGAFKLPPAPQLTTQQAAEIGKGTISRVFGVMQTLDEPGKKAKSGLNRLAASSYDRDAWITIITRLATRTSAGLEDPSDSIKSEANESITLSNTIRETLYLYVLEDFRKRIDIAVTWLCEEWYNDRIQAKMRDNSPKHYDKWVLKVLDGIVPNLDARDKILTRFLSEIPSLSVEILERVKGLCRDPAMVNLSITSLLYLVMFRPPVRELALDAVEDVWATCEYHFHPSNGSKQLTCPTDEDAKPMSAKYLAKWRPGFAERLNSAESMDEKKENGVVPAIEA